MDKRTQDILSWCHKNDVHAHHEWHHVVPHPSYHWNMGRGGRIGSDAVALFREFCQEFNVPLPPPLDQTPAKFEYWVTLYERGMLNV